MPRPDHWNAEPPQVGFTYCRAITIAGSASSAMCPKRVLLRSMTGTPRGTGCGELKIQPAMGFTGRAPDVTLTEMYRSNSKASSGPSASVVVVMVQLQPDMHTKRTASALRRMRPEHAFRSAEVDFTLTSSNTLHGFRPMPRVGPGDIGSHQRAGSWRWFSAVVQEYEQLLPPSDTALAV